MRRCGYGKREKMPYPWTKQAVAGVAVWLALSGTMSSTSCARTGATSVVKLDRCCSTDVRAGWRRKIKEENSMAILMASWLRKRCLCDEAIDVDASSMDGLMAAALDG